MPTIRILFFSLLRDATGTAEITWPLPTPITAGQLFTTLAQHFPALAPWRHSHLIAINQEYARPDTPIPNGAEVAIMPPVQGGVNNAYETPP